MVDPVMTEPYHLCSCGRRYQTRADYVELCKRRVRAYVDREGGLLEQRACHNCGTTQTVSLIERLSHEDMRRAVEFIDSMRESFNQCYTALELMHLWRVNRSCEWDFTPDEWTWEQVAVALLDGTVPKWVQLSSGVVHALDVKDCHCLTCKRGQAVETGT